MHLLTIGEIAKRSGVTVRALRYYESRGLLCPRRTEARQRVYAYRDIVRLQQIQMLKRVGFTIAQIERLVQADKLDPKAILNVQQAILEKQKKALNRSIRLVKDARKSLEAGAEADLSTLCNIIRMGETTMSTEKWQKVWDKYYSAEEQAAWKAAKEAIPADITEEQQHKWPVVIAKVEALVAAGADPAGDAAQAVLEEWRALLKPLAGMKPDLLAGANRLYDDMANWPKDSPAAPFSPEVWAFIKAAGNAESA
jgi:DNA-binding transcriptional MerR regulator